MAASIFNLTIPQLQHWSRRQLPDHRQLNAPVDAINRMTTGIGPPRMRAGVLAATATATAQFKLTVSADAYPDHLVCRAWDGATGGAEDVLVAKPYLLRRTPFDGRTYNGIAYVYLTSVRRQGRIELEEENQHVIPPYVIGDLIYATRGIIGGTSVQVGGNNVVWLEDNRDGRAWAAKFVEL